MEARVDETMSACDMNVLLQEANFVALVESTAKRVDQFEQRFEQRIDMIESDSLQRVEDLLQEVHELAKGGYSTPQRSRCCPQVESTIIRLPVIDCTFAQRSGVFAWLRERDPP